MLFRLDQIVILPGQKLVALFGLLVFVDGDEVDRPHFVDAFLQDGHLLRHGIPVSGSAAGGHLFGRERADPGRTFVGKCDGDALAANLVEVHLIFLLDPFPQVLHRHVFLRQFHLETAALILQFAQTPPLLAQVLLAHGDVARQGFPLRHQLRRLRAHLLAFVLQAAHRPARFFNLRLGLRLARGERVNFGAPPPGQLGQFLLFPEGIRQLFLGRQGDPGFSHGRGGGVALPAQRFKAGVQIVQLPLQLPFVTLQFADPRRQRPALLLSFLFLRRQALDFVNDRVDFLVQHPPGILQRVVLAFARGDVDFLCAQFVLRLLQARLQRGLFAHQHSFAAARVADLILQAGQVPLQLGDLVFSSQNG